jgi:hypothetical protein
MSQPAHTTPAPKLHRNQDPSSNAAPIYPDKSPACMAGSGLSGNSARYNYAELPLKLKTISSSTPVPEKS